ncbi:hypothetical protein BTRA_922 [Burkholderia thailandensis USAMRU Malaysia |uniref:hypothetical protein n=1 Tax=Burkholderia thailandensis TaxID=57975 RepID=UPI00049A07D4|nr:hypothetical protein [Burkholderia thailandensis]AIC88521.1 hypothetical protein BTRA_922 [Burkholderia thailandensis USAMRU Malaysia \
MTTLDIFAIAPPSSQFSRDLRICRPCKPGRLGWLDSLASFLLSLFLSLSLLHLKRGKAGLQYVMLLGNLCNLHMQRIDSPYERGLGLTSRVVHNSFQRAPVEKLVFHQLLGRAGITRIDAFDQQTREQSYRFTYRDIRRDEVPHLAERAFALGGCKRL